LTERSIPGTFLYVFLSGRCSFPEECAHLCGEASALWWSTNGRALGSFLRSISHDLL